MMRMRIDGIEAMRVFAVFGVIIIHTHPFGDPAFEGEPLLKLSFHLMNQASRFAVPFFFIASGYFFGLSIKKGEDPIRLFSRYSRRLFPLFMAWSLVYGLVPSGRAALKDGAASFIESAVSGMAQRAFDNPIALLLAGTWAHLWFLPALLLALFTIAVFTRLKAERHLVCLALLLFVFGLLAGPYSVTPFGIKAGFNTRNGPFFSTLFAVMGWRLSKASGKDVLLRMTSGPAAPLILMACGFFLQIFEAVFLYRHFGVRMNTHNYLLGTVPFGAGAFLLGLSCSGPGRLGVFKPLGRYTLGVYLSHPLFMLLASHYLSILLRPGLFEAAYPFFVYAASVAFTFAVLRSPLAGFLVK